MSEPSSIPPRFNDQIYLTTSARVEGQGGHLRRDEQDLRWSRLVADSLSYMNRILSKIVRPESWARAGIRLTRQWHTAWYQQRVDCLYDKLGPVTNGAGPQTIVADGLWDNPNHFFRLRLFLEALPGIETMRLVGVLGQADDRTRLSLERLGFTEFVAINDHPRHRTETFRSRARTMLAGVQRHADILDLPLPAGLPAYIYYDTVLKLARHPQPGLDNPLWESTLAECLRNCAIYRDLLETIPVTQVIVSHPWKNEFATLMWASLTRSVPAHHLTGYCEGIRVRRFLDTADYATPVEHLSLSEFDALPATVRQKLSADGARYLEQRELGRGTDLNVRYAYRQRFKAPSRNEARHALGVIGPRKLVVIYSHVWFDFPHTFAMRNFTDFFDWMRRTMEEVRAIPELDWVLKPHPTENWYGGFRLQDMAGELPPHVRLAPQNADSLTALTAADIVVTAHGTVGLEAAAHGLPVIAADRSFYSDWGFVHQAVSQEHYIRLLRTARDLPAPDEAGRQRALALISLALAPTPTEVGLIEMRCDSSGPALYKDILNRYAENDPALARERECLRAWLADPSSSYAAHIKTSHFRNAG